MPFKFCLGILWNAASVGVAVQAGKFGGESGLHIRAENVLDLGG